MSISTTYPGVYIQELPSSNHFVTAAPTSIAAFVGFTSPLGPARMRRYRRQRSS
jgi:uncharacterized protein